MYNPLQKLKLTSSITMKPTYRSEQVIVVLDELLLYGEYAGKKYPENTWYFQKLVNPAHPNQIIPDIEVKYNTYENELLIHGNLAGFYQTFFTCGVIISVIIQLFFIGFWIANQEFSIVYIAPSLMLIIIYLILSVSLQWSVSGFKYDLMKELKKVSSR